MARLREKIHHLDDMLKSQQRKVRQMIEQVRGPASPAPAAPEPGPGGRPCPSSPCHARPPFCFLLGLWLRRISVP